MRLIIKEVESCNDCPHQYVMGYDGECELGVTNGPLICECCPECCPLPKIENSNKRLAMQEIERCLDCFYRASSSSDGAYDTQICTNVTPILVVWDDDFPEWCPLPKIDFDPGKVH